MRALAVAIALGALLVPASAASAAAVDVQFSTFGPPQLDLLAGESADWTNVSDRRHTITADDGAFDTDIEPGERISRTFDAVGTFPYHCRLHEGMLGEVDVRRITLSRLPPAAVPVGDRIELDGRTAQPGQPIAIERDSGAGFSQVGTATPAPDSTWRTTITAQVTGDYRATVGGDTSQSRRLLVSERKLIIRATKRGIAVTADPVAPYARIALQIDLRERFGWWPSVFRRLDYLSEATFKVRRPARVRVVLLDTDGWTPLAISRALALGRVGKRRIPENPQHTH
jgi:plastocyanin